MQLCSCSASCACGIGISMSPHLSICQCQGMTCQKPTLEGERDTSTCPPREVQKQVRPAQEAWGKQASGEMCSFFSVKSHPVLLSVTSVCCSHTMRAPMGDKSTRDSVILPAGEAVKSVAQPLPFLKSPKEVTSWRGRGCRAAEGL